MMQLNHQEEDKEKDAAATEPILIEGGVMIVKEPYLKMTADRAYGLGTDYIPDVVFLSAHDERIPSRWRRSGLAADQGLNSDGTWKMKGNAHFGREEYRGAIEM